MRGLCGTPSTTGRCDVDVFFTGSRSHHNHYSQQRQGQACCSLSGRDFGRGRQQRQKDARKRASLRRDSIDEEWQTMRPFFKELDAELEERWASHSERLSAEDARTKLEDSWDFSDDAYTPFPSNLPTMDAGYHPASLRGADRASTSLLGPNAPLRELKQVYVILFGVGETETEGIYSLRALQHTESIPEDIIIAFEDVDDADRYASLLEATMDHSPKACPILPHELVDFCTDSGYCYRLEPPGSLLIPPDYSMGMTDWERSLRLRDGQGWNVLDTEPNKQPGGAPAGAPYSRYGGPYSHFSLHNNAGFYPSSTPSSLDEIRANLERLLPED